MAMAMASAKSQAVLVQSGKLVLVQSGKLALALP